MNRKISVIGALLILLFSGMVPAQEIAQEKGVTSAITTGSENVQAPRNTMAEAYLLQQQQPNTQSGTNTTGGTTDIYIQQPYRTTRWQQLEGLRNSGVRRLYPAYPNNYPFEDPYRQPNATIEKPQAQPAPAKPAQDTQVNRNFSQQNLIGRNFAGRQLSNISFESAVLQSTNFAGAKLSNIDLSNADLRGANFQGASLDKVKLDNAILDNAIWLDGSRCAADSIGTCR